MNIQNLSEREIKKLIVDSSTAYYNGKPILSDVEFDALIEKLKVLDPTSSIPYSLGFNYEVDGIKKAHRIQTSGLPKVKELDSIPIPNNAVITPKYDGLSVTAYYEEDLVEVLTRGGDSGFGKPVTHNLIPFLTSHNLMKMPKGVKAISFECLVDLNTFAKISNTYDLPRSAAAGISQTRTKHDMADCLSLMPIKVYFEDETTLSLDKYSMVPVFEEFFKGTNIPILYNRVKSIEDMKAWANSCGYPTDGVVLWDSIALKFDTEIVETTVTNVIRQLSGLGKLIPVLEFTPVKLYGTSVGRCTMVNEGWVKLHKVGVGSKIQVTKANEIIPQFIKTITEVEYVAPTQCPKCGGPVEMNGDHLSCKTNCISDYYRMHQFIGIHAPMLGFSTATIDRLLNCCEIFNFSELITQAGSFKTSMYASDHESVYLNFLNKTFSEPLNRDNLLLSLNLPGVGAEWSKKLSPYIAKQIPAMTVNVNVLQSLTDNAELIKKVLDRFTWEVPSNVSDGKIKVTITGKLSTTKDEFCKKYNLEQVDLNKSKVLICADPNSNSSKMKTARDKGMDILTEDQFISKYVNI